MRRTGSFGSKASKRNTRNKTHFAEMLRNELVQLDILQEAFDELAQLEKPDVQPNSVEDSDVDHGSEDRSSMHGAQRSHVCSACADVEVSVPLHDPRHAGRPASPMRPMLRVCVNSNYGSDETEDMSEHHDKSEAESRVLLSERSNVCSSPSKGAGSKPGNRIRRALLRARLASDDDDDEDDNDSPADRHARLKLAAARIRDPDYSLRNFHDDMVDAFPELTLYLASQGVRESRMSSGRGGSIAASRAASRTVSRFTEREPSMEPFGRQASARMLAGGAHTEKSGEANKTSSGLSAAAEYNRTMGAFFAFYWLMRLSLPEVPGSHVLDGQRGFSFGVDEDWKPLSSSAAAKLETYDKRFNFYLEQRWFQLHKLLVDAGMLIVEKNGAVSVNVSRVVSMLVLTAIHDIMKVRQLLPKVRLCDAPFIGFDADTTIADHDLALAYVLETDGDALPCYAQLDKAEQEMICFSQSKLDFNHGWFIQAEAPPSSLSSFKRALDRGDADAAKIAFYFVHWLTDLAGADPTPLEGSVKFTVQFPMPVLASIIDSFPLVQSLASRTETELMEQALIGWWPAAVGMRPLGSESIALMRLAVQAQTLPIQEGVVRSFYDLDERDRRTLAFEMSLTGIEGQRYTINQSKTDEGPAFLLYYSPAYLRQSSKCLTKALSHLASVYRGARKLFPLRADSAGETVTVFLDTLKAAGDADAVADVYVEGKYYKLAKMDGRQSSIRLCSLCEGVSADPDEAFNLEFWPGRKAAEDTKARRKNSLA
mmetsp:Transcript_33825/g.71163  ORF Transcript_33825/g.71163 Transcript_33825/m.71163 type:complete len:767 (+) Transcript_33825:1-2301(+)